jgi:hypothetical protein
MSPPQSRIRVVVCHCLFLFFFEKSTWPFPNLAGFLEPVHVGGYRARRRGRGARCEICAERRFWPWPLHSARADGTPCDRLRASGPRDVDSALSADFVPLLHRGKRWKRASAFAGGYGGLCSSNGASLLRQKASEPTRLRRARFAQRTHSDACICDFAKQSQFQKRPRCTGWCKLGERGSWGKGEPEELGWQAAGLHGKDRSGRCENGNVCSPFSLSPFLTRGYIR